MTKEEWMNQVETALKFPNLANMEQLMSVEGHFEGNLKSSLDSIPDSIIFTGQPLPISDLIPQFLSVIIFFSFSFSALASKQNYNLANMSEMEVEETKEYLKQHTLELLKQICECLSCL